MKEQQPAPKRKIESEMIVAIAAAVVGICALGVSFYQTMIMREQQNELSVQRRAEVWPHLEFGKGQRTDELEVLLTNTGIGPARIKSIQLAFRGEPVIIWHDMLKEISAEPQFGYVQSQMSGRVLPAGDRIQGLYLENDLADSLGANFSDIEATFCYCSIYDECWNYIEAFDARSSRELVDKCEAGPTDFRQ